METKIRSKVCAGLQHFCSAAEGRPSYILAWLRKFFGGRCAHPLGFLGGFGGFLGPDETFEENGG